MSGIKLGPGTLTLGTGLDEASFESQLSAIAVEPAENVDEGEDINLLDGTTELGEDNVTYNATVTGTAVQDMTASGLVAYTYENAGDTVAFEFVPNTASGASLVGTCRIMPLKVGGDVKTKNQSDFTFQCPELPTFTPEA